MAKAENLLAVLWLLQSRRRVTAQQVATALEINIRTVYRYIDALCMSGVPITASSGPEGGYSLPDTFRSAPLFFEPVELKAMWQASLLAQYAGYPYTAALAQALRKLRHQLAPAQAEELTRQASTFSAFPMPRGGPVEPWLSLLEPAVADSATVKLLYHKRTAVAPEERVVDPYCVVFHGGLWYLMGHCHARGEVRQFRVDRIRGLERTGETFQRPAAFDPESAFSEERVIGQAHTGPFTQVLLEGPPETLAYICEHYYLQHCVQDRGATSVLLRMDPDGLEVLPALLLPCETAVLVREPESLRVALAQRARRIAEHHERPFADP